MIDNRAIPEALLQQRLTAAGVSWASLCDRCEQIILFGSRAADVNMPNSDYDLLCVVDDKNTITRDDNRVTPGVDLLWISQSRLHSTQWLGSELAQHIAKYGRWLYGADNWSHLVFPSRQAVLSKATQIKERVEALLPRWERFSPPYRRKYSRLVRRDLQRLQMLIRGEAVAPSPILDRLWQTATEPLVKWAETHLETGLVDLSLLSRLEWNELRSPNHASKISYATSDI